MADTGLIYCLLEPGTEEVRYVGKTNNLQYRLRTHLNVKKPTHVSNWLWSLKNKDLVPVVIVLEHHKNPETLNMRECFWIKELREDGHNLTNLTTGGEGTPGLKRGEAFRKAVSERLKGVKFSPERLAKHIAIRTGKRASLETRAKMSAAQKSRRENPLRGLHISQTLKIRHPGRGKAAPNRKLSSDTVKEIRRLRNTEKLSYSKLAKLFNLNRSNIYKICTNKSYITKADL